MPVPPKGHRQPKLHCAMQYVMDYVVHCVMHRSGALRGQGRRRAPRGGGGRCCSKDLEKGWLLNQRGCGSAVAGRHAPGRTTQELAGARCSATTAWLWCRGSTKGVKINAERAKRGRSEITERLQKGCIGSAERVQRGRRVPAPLPAPTRSETRPAAPPDRAMAA